MKVTVAECLELKTFSEAHLLSGESGLTGEVKGISVLDATDEKDFQLLDDKASEILLTGFLGMKEDAEAQCSYVRQAKAKGCVAIVYCPVGKAKGLDKAVINTAAECELPLIQMPSGTTYSKVVSEVMDRILYGDNFRNSLISNTVFHLLNFERYNNFQSAVRAAAINNDFQLVLLSSDFNTVFMVETRHRITIADAVRLGRQKNLEDSRNQVYTLIDVDGTLTYWGLITIGKEMYYMLIVDNNDSYTAGEITKLAEIIELAMGMWKYTPQRDVKAEFIKALLRGNRSLAYNLQEEAKVDGNDVLSAFFTKGVDSKLESRLFTEFEKEADLEIMKVSEDEETFGMILSNQDRKQLGDYQSVCADFFNTMKENRESRIFHVTGINGIEGIVDAYKLINESWSFVQNVFPYKRVFSKYELTLVNNCINIQLQGGFVKKNYMELLEPFKEAGENKGKQLLETLETFVLDAGMNSGKTAEFMNIHTNTVQYRLKKITEMLGVEITGNRIIPGLTMALALKRLERAVS